MTRRGLFIALVLALVAGLVFGIYPELDVAAARVFLRPGGFPISTHAWGAFARDAAMAVVALLVAPAIIALLLKIARPQARMLMPGRAAVFLLTTLILGPGLMANIGLKEHWGRPRPRDLVAFGGPSPFHPWWDPRGPCEFNCSFVAGEAAGGFWTIAPASLAPPRWRALAYAGALLFGSLTGLLRMSVGAHFLSDVIFAGVFTFLIVWLVHALLYRWPATRMSDRAIDRVLEWAGGGVRRALSGATRLVTRRPAR